jgi:hypothetical protein
MNERLDLVRSISNQGIDIQGLEDLSPSKAIVSKSDFISTLKKAEEWGKEALKALRRLGLIDLLYLFSPVLNEIAIMKKY